MTFKILDDRTFYTAAELADYLDYLDDTLELKKASLDPPLTIRLIEVAEETGLKRYGYKLAFLIPDIDI